MSDALPPHHPRHPGRDTGGYPGADRVGADLVGANLTGAIFDEPPREGATSDRTMHTVYLSGRVHLGAGPSLAPCRPVLSAA